MKTPSERAFADAGGSRPPGAIPKHNERSESNFLNPQSHISNQQFLLLVPKLHLGTHLRAQLHCGGGSVGDGIGLLSSPLAAIELPGQRRSQMEFGNEKANVFGTRYKPIVLAIGCALISMFPGCAFLDKPGKYYIGDYVVKLSEEEDKRFYGTANEIAEEIRSKLNYDREWRNDLGHNEFLSIGFSGRNGKPTPRVSFDWTMHKGWLFSPEFSVGILNSGTVEETEEIVRARKCIEEILRKKGYKWTYDVSNKAMNL